MSTNLMTAQDSIDLAKKQLETFASTPLSTSDAAAVNAIWLSVKNAQAALAAGIADVNASALNQGAKITALQAAYSKSQSDLAACAAATASGGATLTADEKTIADLKAQLEVEKARMSPTEAGGLGFVTGATVGALAMAYGPSILKRVR